MHHWASIQRDGRGPAVEIPTSTIVRALAVQPATGYRSLLNVDEWLRTKQAREALGSTRPMVASDTTLLRSMETLETDGIRMALRCAAMEARNVETEPTRRASAPARQRQTVSC
ncbi:MAG: hypothetical protein A3G34_01245 [Candidatus Lindowbacteria bacterium RIFCSPLOWO2_12_FULL_62_27]|nr:MAG: hypothetical protein A3G34_01245 [Candidatus Lindowbacteria bacterium RIFCSPLOWO2_12_FULL_62_27]OGH63696.1 MAG: hypothetical protein A3I06_07695 [Candidatus Lindowbacteria bacterium RIFCSPLOWO2_02_FULL_62_12]